MFCLSTLCFLRYWRVRNSLCISAFLRIPVETSKSSKKKEPVEISAPASSSEAPMRWMLSPEDFMAVISLRLCSMPMEKNVASRVAMGMA